jgi:type II secretory pathway pseudopilin PulG
MAHLANSDWSKHRSNFATPHSIRIFSRENRPVSEVSAPIWHRDCSLFAVVFHKNGKFACGFTLVEAVVAITLLGIGITTAITAMTRFNMFASSSRNLTGAYTAVMTQIDAIDSAAPFDPLHLAEDGSADPQIPDALVLDSARGGNPLSEAVRVYVYKDPKKDPSDPTADIVVVNGTRTTSVVDCSTVFNSATVPMRRATVTVTYNYLGKNYSYSMSTVRSGGQ